VNILLSTNGDFTYPILLGSKVPNDGSETITAPNLIGNSNRIMVRGNNHNFYDISNTNFTITIGSNTFLIAYDGTNTGQNNIICQENSVSYTINYQTLGTYSANTSFTIVGNPAGSTTSFINTNGPITLLVNNLSGIGLGEFEMVVTATSSGIYKTVPLYLSKGISLVALVSPLNNAIAQNTILNLSWNANSSAISYDLELELDVNFTSIIQTSTITSTNITISGLQESKNYFWRVRPIGSNC
jgi:hypothetical protein